MRPRRPRFTSTPRSRNRKGQILAAASVLFSECGCHNVGTEDSALPVAVTARALYRHFGSEQELLAARWPRASIRQVSCSTRTQPMTARPCCTGSRKRPALDVTLGVLWNRDIRHLAPEQQAGLHGRLHGVVSRLSAVLGNSVPGIGGADADCWRGALLPF